jgi:muramoyltetrapeptide carboxypeptidase
VPKEHLINDQSRTFRPRRPPLLSEGARVALVAPAGPLRDETDVERARENVRAFGWEPIIGTHALARDGYFAGDDAQRASDMNRALADDTIDAVWCLRGGYGTMRILDALDYDAVARRPKPVIGYSDITALHAALSLRCDMVTYHGPTCTAATPAVRLRTLASCAADRCRACWPAETSRS